MPYEVRLIKDPTRPWPSLIHNIYRGNVSTEDVVNCVNETLRLLDQQESEIDVIGVFEADSNFLNARGVLFQKPLLDQLTWHEKMGQVIVVDLNQVITGDFTKNSLQAILSGPKLQVSIVGSMEELNTLLEKKYSGQNASA